MEPKVEGSGDLGSTSHEPSETTTHGRSPTTNLAGSSPANGPSRSSTELQSSHTRGDAADSQPKLPGNGVNIADDKESLSSEASDGTELLDPKDDEGWEDVEPDVEHLTFVDLFSGSSFEELPDMVEHMRSKWNFDLVEIRNKLSLDFLETVKLINYIRASTQKSDLTPDLSSKQCFEDDQYLIPVLQDDALLYSFEDLDPTSLKEPDLSQTQAQVESNSGNEEHTALKARMEKMDSLLQSLIADEGEPDSLNEVMKRDISTSAETYDKQYFDGYAERDIHETMLKDTVRTDTYRDFIYGNKHLFKNKVVLDVGCGTGILSMMSARAGAKMVLAVDNSNIINKARQNVFDNGLSEIVTCIHGKIEEVALPVPKVDIIISEWMGYGLLHEAMLDSVLFARDKYLVEGGIVAPSHITLFAAPFSSSEYSHSRINFWDDVYGFKMSSMKARIYEDILIDPIQSENIVGKPYPILHLALQQPFSKKILTASHEFEMSLDHDIDCLDGFVIWFDTFFGTSQDATIPADARAENWKNCIAFSTGPFTKTTHWCQSVLLIDREKAGGKSLKSGQTIKGTIKYEPVDTSPRHMGITVDWSMADEGLGSEDTEKGNQRWFMP